MSNRINPPAIVRGHVDLNALAIEINEGHELVENYGRNTLIRSKKVGKLLIRAKKECGHGHWLPWLKNNVKFSRATAAAYMKVAENWLKCKAALHLEGALSTLSSLELGENQEAEKSSLPERSGTEAESSSNGQEEEASIDADDSNGEEEQEEPAPEPEPAERVTPNRLPVKDRIVRDLDDMKNRQARTRETIHKLKGNKELSIKDMKVIRDRVDSLVKESSALRNEVE